MAYINGKRVLFNSKIRIIGADEEALDREYNNGYSDGHTVGYEKGKNERNAVMFSILDRTVTEVKAEDLEGLTIVADYAFARCRSLKSVELPEGITYLQLGAFQECSALSSLILPKSLEVINQNALAGVPLLTELTIYEKIRFVGNGALRTGSVENPATIRFLKTTPVAIGSNSFDTSILKKIVVPQGSKEVYAEATNWCDLTDYIYEENWLYVDTIYTNGSGDAFEVEGVGHPYKVGRYLCIEALAFSDQAYITGEDIIANCESFTIEGLPGSVYNGDIVFGKTVIDLYEHYTKEEVENLCEKDVQYNITCTPNDPDIDGIYPDSFEFHCYFSDAEE